MMQARFLDHFSGDSERYARFRPRYPDSLFRYLAQQCRHDGVGWDCATGSGQAALGLAPYLNSIIATDGSLNQLHHASRHPRVHYVNTLAEIPFFRPSSLALVTVAQALHWFDIPRFFERVEESLEPMGILAVWTYGLFEVSPTINSRLRSFYSDIVGEFWPLERQLVDRAYSDIAFPMTRVPTPAFAMEAEWSFSEVMGYVGTWSAVQRYRVARSRDPLGPLDSELRPLWGETPRRVRWPLHLFLRRKV